MAGSGVSSAARCRNAAAAASPPRPCARSAERAISAATASSGIAVACARCQARRSGSSDRIRRVGERLVHVAAVARVRRAVDRRADERMREAHACAELDQPGRLGRPPGLGADPEPLGGAPQQAHIAERLGRRRQEQKLRVARKRLDALKEAVLDAARQRARVGEPEPARELRRRQSARQLDQREGVAAAPRRGSGPSPARRAARGSSRPAAAGRRRPAAPRSRAPATPRARARRRDSRTANTNPDPLRQQPARHERERLRGHPVEPLRVVDDAHERLLLGGVGQQAQDGQPDEEALRRRPGAQAERRAQRVALRARQMSRDGRAWARTARAGRRSASSISDSTPAARATRHPCAAVERCRSRAVLPTPASPRRTSTRLWPARTPATSRSSTSALVVAVEQCPTMAGGGRACRRRIIACRGGVGSSHDPHDSRPPEPVRTAAVAASPRRAAPACPTSGTWPRRELWSRPGSPWSRPAAWAWRRRSATRTTKSPADEMLAAAARIARGVDVPVTVDAEAGYGWSPASWSPRCGGRGGGLQSRGHRPRRPTACEIRTGRRSG